MDLGLKGKYALVTGGSHGIGRSIALSLAREGCNVAICARDDKKLNKVIQEIRDKNVFGLAISADATNIEDIDIVMEALRMGWGKLDILINNVGGGGSWGNPDPTKTSEDTWREVYDKNAAAAIRFTQRAIPLMRKEKWGRVVTISSIGSSDVRSPWYNMAKSAQISFMKSLSMNTDLVRDGITFNSVAPGFIMISDTGLDKRQKENPEEFNKFVLDNFPLGRLGLPDEVASIVTFICSQSASLLNGACVVADGGQSKSF